MKRFALSFARALALAALFGACSFSKRDGARDSKNEDNEEVPVLADAGRDASRVEPAAGEGAGSKDEGIDPYADRGFAQPGVAEGVDRKQSRLPEGRQAPSRPVAPAVPEPAPPREEALGRSRTEAKEAEASATGSDPYANSLPSAKAGPKRSEGAGAFASERDSRCGYVGCLPAPAYIPPPTRRPDAEEYAPIHENAFQDARSQPLSTFSIDVDGASYANVRRFLQDNRLPPPDAVRIEELINNFAFDYPQPRGADPFTITTETAATPWNPDTRLVLVGLQGRRIEERRLPPSNLVFLIDVSGSMASADKLPLLKDAFDLLVDRLRREDRISIVVYAGAAGMVLPPTRGDDKETIREALSRLEAGGSTAGGAGLMLAYQAARQSFIPGGSNRVILATDGDFNVGLSGDEELARFIEAKRKTGVHLSVLGFGTGNYKDARMEQLAGKGDGNYYYIDGIHEARKVLVEKMSGTLHAIAKDVKLQVEFNPAAVKSYRLIGYENRVLAAEDFNDDAKDAGDLGAGHTVTALYEVVPAAPARPRVDPLKYQGGKARRWFRDGGEESAAELLTVKFRYKHPGSENSRLLSRTLKNRDNAWREASDNFRFAAAVAGFGLLLRESRYRGELGYGLVHSLARGARGKDANGDRAEFVHLVGSARLLAETEAYGMPER